MYFLFFVFYFFVFLFFLIFFFSYFFFFFFSSFCSDVACEIALGLDLARYCSCYSQEEIFALKTKKKTKRKIKKEKRKRKEKQKHKNDAERIGGVLYFALNKNSLSFKKRNIKKKSVLQ